MITLGLLLFWGAAGFMFHSYVLYPFLLKLLAMGKKQNDVVYLADNTDLPEVYVVFAVYNEERVIREKLESVFKTSYPLNKLQVYIGSDNSTDNTNIIVDEFAAKFDQLHFYKFEGRNGKSKVINNLMTVLLERKATGALVFTDANVMFTPDTIYHLVKHFKKEDIGQVGANIQNKGVSPDGISHQEKSYIQRENQLKYLEGLNWGSMVGAFGACYAMRMNLWTDIPPNYLMEDFYLSMSLLAKGKKSILEQQAICYEDVSNEVDEEYKRKTRIQAGNFQNLSVYWPLLFRFNAVAFCFFSHKVIRWFGPMLILLAYVGNALLLLYHPFYILTFIIQNILLLSPVIDRAMKRINVNIRLLRFASYFIMMNIALIKGFQMYRAGVKTSVWNPTKRNV